jgi:ribonuclease BN (tRNA processing enzyme)
MIEKIISRKPEFRDVNNTIKWVGDQLSLTNDGKLELFFIGVGSAFATSMNQSNLLLVKGNTHLLIDCGMTGPMALNQTAGLKLTDIEAIFPTHSHADHIGGIEGIALMNRYVGQRFFKKPKTKMIITEEYQRILWDYSLRGGLEYNEELIGVRKMQFSDYFDIERPRWKCRQPREMFEIDFNLNNTGKKEDTINLEIFRTTHIPEQSSKWEASFVSYGLFIDNKVLVSGDTKFDPELIDIYGDRAETIFHDIQFFSGGVHTDLKELKTLPTHIKRKLYPYHYADDFEKHDISEFAGWTKQGCRYIF